MPILTPHTVTPRLFITSSPKCLHTQIRLRHETAVANPVCDQASLEQDVNGYAPPLRVRKHGFRALPVSPLIREGNAKRPRKAIGQQHDSLKDFQKEVALNPYAQALATPIRACTLTLARLPSHFLLPFTTTIERPLAATTTQTPKMKAHIHPGYSADFAEETLTQTSYVLNRQDLVRHLSRRRHWTNLITDRQKEKFASMAHRSPSSHKLVQDHWVWEDRGDATHALLEKKAVAAIKRAVEACGQDTCSSPSLTGQDTFVLVFDRNEARDGTVEAQAATGCQAYELSTLLSTESLDILQRELAQPSTGTIYISKTSEACQAQLAMDRLKSFNESNEVHKELPQVQNPPGTREARLRRQQLELESGAVSEGRDKTTDAV